MSEKKEKVLKQESIPPMGLKMIFREFLKDKMAIFSLVLLVAVLLFVFIGSAVIDQSQVMRVSILDKYAVPGAISPNGGTYLLGADEGGRDVWGQLIIGARNSILIGFSITIITSIVGVGLGIISGYYGGIIDNILMRIVDFVMILPIMLIIIVIVSIVPRYNVWTFTGSEKQGSSEVRPFQKAVATMLVHRKPSEPMTLSSCSAKSCRTLAH